MLSDGCAAFRVACAKSGSAVLRAFLQLDQVALHAEHALFCVHDQRIDGSDVAASESPFNLDQLFHQQRGVHQHVPGKGNFTRCRFGCSNRAMHEWHRSGITIVRRIDLDSSAAGQCCTDPWPGMDDGGRNG